MTTLGVNEFPSVPCLSFGLMFSCDFTAPDFKPI